MLHTIPPDLLAEIFMSHCLSREDARSLMLTNSLLFQAITSNNLLWTHFYIEYKDEEFTSKMNREEHHCFKRAHKRRMNIFRKDKCAANVPFHHLTYNRMLELVPEFKHKVDKTAHELEKLRQKVLKKGNAFYALKQELLHHMFSKKGKYIERLTKVVNGDKHTMVKSSRHYKVPVLASDSKYEHLKKRSTYIPLPCEREPITRGQIEEKWERILKILDKACAASPKLQKMILNKEMSFENLLSCLLLDYESLAKTDSRKPSRAEVQRITLFNNVMNRILEVRPKLVSLITLNQSFTFSAFCNAIRKTDVAVVKKLLPYFKAQVKPVLQKYMQTPQLQEPRNENEEPFFPTRKMKKRKIHYSTFVSFDKPNILALRPRPSRYRDQKFVTKPSSLLHAQLNDLAMVHLLMLQKKYSCDDYMKIMNEIFGDTLTAAHALENAVLYRRYDIVEAIMKQHPDAKLPKDILARLFLVNRTQYDAKVRSEPILKTAQILLHKGYSLTTHTGRLELGMTPNLLRRHLRFKPVALSDSTPLHILAAYTAFGCAFVADLIERQEATQGSRIQFKDVLDAKSKSVLFTLCDSWGYPSNNQRLVDLITYLLRQCKVPLHEPDKGEETRLIIFPLVRAFTKTESPMLPKVLSSLLEAGAPVQLPEAHRKRKYSPLEMLLNSKQGSSTRHVAKMLISYGACITPVKHKHIPDEVYKDYLRMVEEERSKRGKKRRADEDDSRSSSQHTNSQYSSSSSSSSSGHTERALQHKKKQKR